MRGISWLAEELFPSKKGYHRRLSDFVQSKLCDNINTHLRLPEQWQGWSVFWRHQVRIWGAEPVSITTVFRSVRKIAKKKKKEKSEYQLRYVCPSAWNNSGPNKRIFMTFEYFFFKFCRENSSFIKIWKRGVLYMKTYVQFSYLISS